MKFLRLLLCCLCALFLVVAGCLGDAGSTSCTDKGQCLDGQICLSGKCSNCSDGQKACGNKCVDLATDKQHCGQCAQACTKEQTCKEGSCACTGEKSLCDGVCIDTKTSLKHCGSCGNACPVKPGYSFTMAIKADFKGVGDIFDSVIDKDGNLYVTGLFSETANFGNDYYRTKHPRERHSFVAKMSPDGEWLWSKELSTSMLGHARAVLATDNAGNVYVAGGFSGLLNLDGRNYGSKGNNDIFVVKYSASGDFQWAKVVGTPSHDNVAQLQADKSGNVYLTGSISMRTSFGSHKVTPTSTRDSFVAKLSAKGEWMWAKNHGKHPYSESSAIALDAKGNVYVTGRSAKSMVGPFSHYTFKMDANGTFLWEKQGGGSSITLDKENNIYVQGVLSDNLQFGGLSLKRVARVDRFVAKADAAGNWQWTKVLGKINEQEFNNGTLALDQDGNIVLSVSFTREITIGKDTHKSAGNDRTSSDILVAKMDPKGNWLWSTRAGDTNLEFPKTLVLDQKGRLFLTGFFWGRVSFNQSTVIAKELNAFFVTRLETDKSTCVAGKCL